MTPPIRLYGSSTCPAVPAVRSTLQRAAADFEYINISRDPQARATVIEINAGYASVPTLVFPDGSTLTEPTSQELEARLRDLGYEIPPATLWQRVQVIGQNPLVLTLGIVFLAIGVGQRDAVLLATALALLALAFGSRIALR